MKKIILYIMAIVFVLNATAQEKELPPKGGKPKDFKLPEKQTISLENGLELVMVPYGAIPKATINIRIKTGNIHEKENQVWLSDLLADLMEEGSETSDAKSISNTMASMGGNLNIYVNSHATTLNTNVLSEYAGKAIFTMADVLMHPKWPASDLDRLKNDMKRSLTIRLSRPQAQVSKDFYAAIYPNHPYGNIYPTEEMIDSYTIDNIKQFYKANFGAKRTVVYVVGKFDASEVEKAVKETFAVWKEGPEVQYPQATPVTKHEVKIIDRPGAPQSTIMYGLPTIGPSNPDYLALSITNSLLGGSFGSRITSNIREDKGYTYSPYSNLQSNYKTGVWYESADVTSQYTGASIEEIKKEIYKLQDSIPSKKELSGIKNYVSGVFVLQNSTPSGIVNQLSFLDLHELPESWLENKVKNIMELTPEQITEMTKKYIKPEGMTLIVVGDKEKIKYQLRETFEKDSLEK
ncbi:M16 family metallopeptidase [Galbibacter pacificus]|uniref:Pitrilysin family protein n=1 Tax=Galbibacter pacificus TaxID=2996052 RepID=A0ABT6FMB0_9FLAO|nr:pitrilysin family protein [Galbibacter pacificus]MDG3580925.1 pitrilysin family protein [Galbibacter pacificus]MDG3584403.1 pitrilysin family protein [Galbibacter pacificus]